MVCYDEKQVLLMHVQGLGTEGVETDPVTQSRLYWLGEPLLGLVGFLPGKSPVDPITQCRIMDLKHKHMH